MTDIASTLAPQDASKQHWDALILGAGPAGVAAAIAAARHNLKILLIDKARFPRNKVCGGCLNQSALDTLNQLGFDNLPARLAALPTNRMILASRDNQASFHLPPGIAVSRYALDAALIDHAVRSGVAFLCGSPAHITAPGQVTLSDITLTASVVVLADGLKGTANPNHAPDVHTHPNSRLGAAALLSAHCSSDYAPGIIHMACHAHGYVGLVRVENNLLNIAAALDPAFIQLAHGVTPAITTVLMEAGLPVPDLSEADWNAVSGLTRSRTCLWQPRLLITGDAGGYIEPFTGEGMAWALSGGLALFPHLLAAKSGWSDAIGHAWQCDHAARIAARQGLCRVLAWSLRRPLLIRLAIGILRLFPALATPFTRRLNAPLTLSIPQRGTP